MAARRLVVLVFALLAATYAAALPTAAPASALVRTSADPWFWENALPQGNSLNDICFVTPSLGWVSGDAGTVMKTTDGGSTWSLQPTGATESLQTAVFIDASHGWVAGYGVLYRTVDGGASWQAQDLGGWWIKDMAAIGSGAWDTRTLVAVGIGGKIRRSTDGGVTWTTPTVTPAGTNASLNGVAFGTDTVGWIVGDWSGSPLRATILKTTDGGVTWTVLSNSPASASAQCVAARGETNLWVGATEGRILSSTDGGASWGVYQHSSIRMPVHDVAFVSDNDGVAVVGDDEQWSRSAWLWTTADGGVTWIPSDLASPSQDFTLQAVTVRDAGQPSFAAAGTAGTLLTSNGAVWTRHTSGIGHHLFDIDMANSTQGWAVGRRGLILRTEDGKTWAPQTSGLSSRVNAVVALSADEAFAGGIPSVVHQSVVHTVDGGQTWTPQGTLGLSGAEEILDLSFSAPATGWGCTYQEVIRTINGGVTWTTTSASPGAGISAIAAIDASTAVVVGYSGLVRRTIDTGTSWNPVTLPTGYETADIYTVSMATPSIGWLAGGGGTILTTVDGGLNWAAQASGSNQLICSLNAVSAAEAWACTTEGTILHLAEGETTWVAESSGTTNALRAIAPVAGGVWAAGDNGSLLVRDIAAPTIAPVFSPAASASGWYLAAPTVTFNASDALAGVASVESRVNGGPWVAGDTLLLLQEGTATVEVRTADEAGNTTTYLLPAIRTDTVAPVTGDDLPAGSTWMKPRAVTITASDAYSGVAGVYYAIDGGAVAGTAGSSAVVAGLTNGLHVLRYWAVDAAGKSSESAAVAKTVRFDGKRPVPKALAAATVRKGKKATLRYRVNDGLPGCGKANVTITIKTVKGRTVKTLPVVKGAAVNTDRKASFVCKLKPGTYYYWVAATDIAGNKGTKTASAKLTVK